MIATLLIKVLYGIIINITNKNTDTEIVSAGFFLVGITLFIKHIGILINYYLSMDQINYGSIFVIFISFLLIFRTDLLKNLYLKFNK